MNTGANIKDVLQEIEHLDVSDVAKEKVKDMLRRLAGERVFFTKAALVKPMQLSLATSLLNEGMPRAEVQKALSERLGLSQDTAYRRVLEALSKRGPQL